MSNGGGDTVPASSYVLGHADRELERLRTQARLIDPITRQFFRDAGIVPGMRVLDVGSGAGDVAFLTAALVGDAGEVTGMDRAPAALAAARARADALSLRNVSFRDGDLTTMAFERPFDAVVGRYVLQFAADPSAALRTLSRHLRPGGAMVFHELDWGGVQSFPPVPTFDRCCRWILEAFRLSGTEARMGIKLHSAFVGAGLAAPSMRMEAIAGGAANASDCLHLFADLTGTLLPTLVRLGVATAAEVDIETLAAKMQAEAIATGSVIVGHSQFGAWTRT